MSGDRRAHAVLLALLLIAAVLRVAAALATGERELRGDEGYYVEAATTLAREGRHPGAFRPPGYAGFVAGVLWASDGSLTAVRWAQAALSLLVVAVVFDVVRRRFGTAPAFVSGLLCATSPTLVHYTQLFWSETLVTVGLCAVVWCFDRLDATARPLWGVLTGLALGASALAREMYAYLSPAVAACLLPGARDERRTRLASGALLVVVAIAVVLPWAMRNQRVLGRFELATNRWLPIAAGNLPSADGTLLGVADERSIIAPYNRTEDPLAAEEMARRVALETIAAQQPWWIARKIVRSTYFLYAPVSQLGRFVERGWLLHGHPGAGHALLRLEQTHYALLMVLGIAGLWLVPGGPTQLLAVLLILFHMAIYVLANANHRFRVPLLPLFALYAGPLVFGRVARDAWRRARLGGAAVCLTVFLAILVAGGELHEGARRGRRGAGATPTSAASATPADANAGDATGDEP